MTRLSIVKQVYLHRKAAKKQRTYRLPLPHDQNILLSVLFQCSVNLPLVLFSIRSCQLNVMKNKKTLHCVIHQIDEPYFLFSSPAPLARKQKFKLPLFQKQLQLFQFLCPYDIFRYFHFGISPLLYFVFFYYSFLPFRMDLNRYNFLMTE